MKLYKYTSVVIDAIKDYCKENLNQNLSNTDVQMMYPRDVLRMYLEWEGIIGYTWIIENILLDREIE